MAVLDRLLRLISEPGGSVAWGQCRASPIADVDGELLFLEAGAGPRLCCDHVAPVGSGARLPRVELNLAFDVTLPLLLVFMLLEQELILVFAAIVQLLPGEGVRPLFMLSAVFVTD